MAPPSKRNRAALAGAGEQVGEILHLAFTAALAVATFYVAKFCLAHVGVARAPRLMVAGLLACMTVALVFTARTESAAQLVVLRITPLLSGFTVGFLTYDYPPLPARLGTVRFGAAVVTGLVGLVLGQGLASWLVPSLPGGIHVPEGRGADKKN